MCRHGAIKPKRIRNLNLDLLITKNISRAREVPEQKKSKKFPAIRQETLSSDRPVLDDASNGNIIDFYGPCSEDSCGMDQVRQQKREVQHRWDPDKTRCNDNEKGQPSSASSEPVSEYSGGARNSPTAFVLAGACIQGG